MRSRQFVKGVIFVIALGLASSAGAVDRDKARQAFQLGVQHYELAEYKEALEAFKEAYRNYDDAKILFNIGQCYRQLGERDQAMRFYRMYLIKQPDAPNRDEVRGYVAALEPRPVPTAAAPAEKAKPVAVPSNVVVAQSTAPARRATPAYKKWWLWTGVGVVAAGIGVGLGVGLSHGPAAAATTSFGTVHPF